MDSTAIFVILLGLVVIINGLRLKGKQGVVPEENFNILLVVLIFTIVRNIINGEFLEPLIITIVVFGTWVMVGRSLTVYDITEEKFNQGISDIFNQWNIDFREENQGTTTYYHLDDYNSSVKVVKKVKKERDDFTFHVFFRKWWRLPKFKLVKQQVVRKFREDRENQLFSRQVTAFLGVGGTALILGLLLITM